MTRGKKSRKRMGLPHLKAVVWEPFSLGWLAMWRAGQVGTCGRPVVTGCPAACHSGLDCLTSFSPGRVFHQSRSGAAWAAFDGYLIWMVALDP